ncbi:MAG: tRNA pseudouridine38-40 synthase [Planctomycetota bacterium]|jgi:tRNA pseudouridine38-40 synthase
MAKFAVGIEYSGQAYCGWQRQPHCYSVQQAVETAISFVANHPVELGCAGRTDSGVHAIEQIAHFESESKRSERAWMLGSNTKLPKDIRLKWVVPVDGSFHARFSATAREYRYVVLNMPVASAIFSHLSAWEYQPLEHNLMHDCAQILLGEHDFGAFRAAGCQSKTAMRDLQSIQVSRNGNMIYFDIKANAFLYHMVRNIVGSLLLIGRGEKSKEWFGQVFSSKDRTLAAPTASASGLYFVKAFYPEHYNLPQKLEKPVLF